MNQQKLFIAVAYLLVTGVTAGLLSHARAGQRLGAPGVLTVTMPGKSTLKVVLPDELPGYSARVSDPPDSVVKALPNDTSFGSGKYAAPDGFFTSVNVVLMGTDRTSIHKPQFCLTGQGWTIEDAATKTELIHIKQPFAYDLPVMRLTASITTEIDGQPRLVSGTYVYWFVDGTDVTAEHLQRNLWTMRDILLTGVLDRFAYISFFSACNPGQEDATFERMKQVIAEAVPKFQLVPKTAATGGR